MLCRATQDERVMVKSSDKMWSTGDGNGKLLQHSCLENRKNIMKRQKDMTLKDEILRSVGAQYATEEEWRNNTRKNEEMEPKGKQHRVVDVTGGGSNSLLMPLVPLMPPWHAQCSYITLVCHLVYIANIYIVISYIPVAV